MMQLQHRIEAHAMRSFDAACVPGLGTVLSGYPTTSWLTSNDEPKQARGANP